MKRIWSVAMLATRQVVWKLLLILVVLSALELGVFWYNIPKGLTLLQFGALLDRAKFFWFLRAAIVALFVFQMYQGMDSRGRMNYTLRRLPMGERAVTTIWALCHAMTYWVLWAAQLAVVLVCWRLYCMNIEIGPRSLELFTQFYRNEFLHGLLPMQNYARGVTNFLMMLTLGFSAAYAGFRTRNRQKIILPIVTLSMSINMISANYRDDIVEGILITYCLVVLGYMIWKIWVNAYEET